VPGRINSALKHRIEYSVGASMASASPYSADLWHAESEKDREMAANAKVRLDNKRDLPDLASRHEREGEDIYLELIDYSCAIKFMNYRSAERARIATSIR
jgi:hypothetical protein